jgi:hypothetical protein
MWAGRRVAMQAGAKTDFKQKLAKETKIEDYFKHEVAAITVFALQWLRLLFFCEDFS